jgi:hypothetical protein
MEFNFKPEIKWDYFMGPLLCCNTGNLHLLTKLEILYLKLGFTNLEKLNKKYSTDDQKG